MLRVSAIILVTITLLVGGVLPRDDGSAVSTTVEATTRSEPNSNSSNSSEPVTESAAEPTTRPPPVDQRKNEKLAESKPGRAEKRPVESSSNATEKMAGPKEWANCTYAEEPKDMQKCFVIEQGGPRDDDDDDDAGAVQASTDSTAEPTTKTIVANKEGAANVTKPAADQPKTTMNQGTTWLNRTAYVTVTAEPDTPKNASVTESSNVDRKPDGRTEEPVSSVAPLLADNVRMIESETIAETAKSTDRNDNNNNSGMPGGVIALVTAVTFAILIVIGYVGMVAWRRYLEYRYGHRELLVNDLEFDGNDLRHFEL